jgi:hypothetical protein
MDRKCQTGRNPETKNQRYALTPGKRLEESGQPLRHSGSLYFGIIVQIVIQFSFSAQNSGMA